ncbi:hypothetical protein H0X09_00070 [Candidatus Saccharibacteria bacterium]|nr:hypothetical protein [Candidatus Saccharibacteria bacterium]
MKKIKTHFRRIVMAATACFALALFISPAVALAIPDPGGGGSGGTTPPPAKTEKSTSIGDPKCDDANTTKKLQECLKENAVVKKLQLLVNFLSIGVGVVVVAMIIFGGIRYIMAGDNPNAVTEAKNHITNALIALLAFIFVSAFLQWLIPGGVFD